MLRCFEPYIILLNNFLKNNALDFHAEVFFILVLFYDKQSFNPLIEEALKTNFESGLKYSNIPVTAIID